MSIRGVIVTILLCVSSVTSATAGVFLYVLEGGSRASMSGPSVLMVAPDHEPPESIHLTYDDTFGQRGYRIDRVRGDSAVAAALLRHIDVSGGLRKPDLTLKRVTQQESFELQPDQLRHPNAILVISDEASHWETPAGTVIDANDPLFADIYQLYQLAVGKKIPFEGEPADVDPDFDFNRLAQLVEYPETARLGNLEGQVMVAALIAADGTVFSAVVTETDHPVFNEAAIRAVLLTEFIPAKKDDTPIPLWVRIPIAFELQ